MRSLGWVDTSPRRCVFGGDAEPIARVGDGAAITMHTDDCFGGKVRTAHDLPSQVVSLDEVNPVTGPFFVEGALPGDTLALHFASIEPASDWGVSATYPHFGALTSTHETATLQPPLDEHVWIYRIDGGQVRWETLDGRWLRLPLDPMFGTVGVAPAGGQALTTLTCGPHGGNLDLPAIRPGVTVYLGVNVAGAMFSIGDGHARQGDGEACGVGVECAMRTRVVVGLIPGTPTPWPRIESPTHLLSVGAARPLEDAYRIAHTDMVGWVAQLTGMGVMDAYQWLSQAGTAQVGNVCDPNYTLAARIDKGLLPDGAASAYQGTHDRLAAIAASR